jgi:hypothetical protein
MWSRHNVICNSICLCKHLETFGSVCTLYPQKLALASPTSGSRSVGIVCSRTKATEFSLVFIIIIIIGSTAFRWAWAHFKVS